MRPRHGMVLGKFMPPHRGHLYLVRFARAFVDELTVVVGTLQSEPIPGKLRFSWMRELCPDARVVHLEDENPQDPSEHPDFWGIWKRSLKRVVPQPVDYVFASESYGRPLAEALGAEYIPVDTERVVVPISGTEARRDPWAAWDYLPECVRPYFLKRVVVFGPESTGKSTLARRLAEHFGTSWVPEYAREWLEHTQAAPTAEDFERIARGQMASEDALAREAHRILFLDTDLMVTPLWSERLLGRVEPWIAESARRRRADLYLLLDSDVPWIEDSVRYLPGEGAAFFEQCESTLLAEDARFVTISGDWDTRFEAACAAVEELIAEGPPSLPSFDLVTSGAGSGD